MQSRVVSTGMKLTQKVDYLSVIDTSFSTGCCLKRFLPKGWLDEQGSIRDAHM